MAGRTKKTRWEISSSIVDYLPRDGASLTREARVTNDASFLVVYKVCNQRAFTHSQWWVYSPARKSGWKLARILYRGSYYSIFPFHGWDGINFCFENFFRLSVGIDINFAGRGRKEFLSVTIFFSLCRLGRINTASRNFLANKFLSSKSANSVLISSWFFSLVVRLD